MSSPSASPVVAGAITGARFWVVDVRVEPEAGLMSPRGTPWNAAGAPTFAECPWQERECPGRDCSCGIHAFHPDSPDFDPGSLAGRRTPTGELVVWGEIEAWGEIEVHRSGFRAEAARPRRICVPYLLDPKSKARIRQVAEAHGAQVVGERTWFGKRRKPDPVLGLNSRTVEDLLSIGA